MDEGGTRRSTRNRVRPLQYWRGESKTYGRDHNSKCCPWPPLASVPVLVLRSVPTYASAVRAAAGRTAVPPLDHRRSWPNCPLIPPRAVVRAALPTVKGVNMRTPNPKWPLRTEGQEKDKRKARTRPAADAKGPTDA